MPSWEWVEGAKYRTRGGQAVRCVAVAFPRVTMCDKDGQLFTVTHCGGHHASRGKGELDVVERLPDVVSDHVERYPCDACGAGHKTKAERYECIAKQAEKDEVNHPPHYTQHPSGVECITITRHMNFNLGNAFKYIWRAGLKSDDAVTDLHKAVWYLTDEIKRLKGGAK